MDEKITIHSKIYDLLLYLVPVLEKYPRTQKFLIADRIQIGILDILDLLIESYYSQKENKKILLQKTNIKLEQLRYLFRLSYDLKYINISRYEFINEKIFEIGKMVGGWLKSIK